MTRFVVLHYHLFKNAGTSLDAALKTAFGDAWADTEAPDGRQLKPDEVGAWLEAHPDITVLSSHTAMLPPPDLPDTTILPVLFVRHPLDRIRSVYDFERRQQTDNLAARMAKQLTLRQYVEWRLGTKGDRAIRDFQCYRLAANAPGPGTERDRALTALHQLPCVGVVEEYDRSLRRLERLLATHMPDIALPRHHSNATRQGESTVAERVEHLRHDLGEDLFAELRACNDADIVLHEEALERIRAAA